MTGDFRTAAGGLVDRGQTLTFRFNGRSYSGHPGDTLASALIANGAQLVGRSFKYHRPRGILSAGVEEPNAIVRVGSGGRVDTNAKATEIELVDGLEATSVNCWPGPEFDVNAAYGWFGRLFAAGFPYKTFFGSPWLWRHVFEPWIRRSAGLGTAPTAPDPDTYDHKHVHCDVLVVGAGPAGLAAATVAARAGARVIVADQQTRFGGDLLGAPEQIDGRDAIDWVAERTAELDGLDEVTCLRRTTVFGYYQDNYLCALERLDDRVPTTAHLRLWHIRAGQVILATGAHERPLVFPNNDRPGIMLAGAAQTYVNRYGAIPGRRAVLATNNDGGYRAALDLVDAGIELAAAVDARESVTGHWPAILRDRGIDVLTGAVIEAVAGRKRVRSVTAGGRRIDCDLVIMSGGWSPVVHLYSQAGGRLTYDDDLACFRPDDRRPGLAVIGAANGAFGMADVFVDALRAGAAAVQAAGFGNASAPSWACAEPEMQTIQPVWSVPNAALAKQFVDYQNDTTVADIHLAAREGFESVEHMKRYTLAGFGTDQGKTGNINALANLSDALGRPISETGTTTFRPPYTPVPFGALAGRDVDDFLDPIRTTAMYDWHVNEGAVFEDVGQWKRPWYYPRAGEDMRAAVDRECLAVRDGVGLLDASTLGKIDVRGPDAARFLDRIYTNDMAALKPGRIRYGLMCHEDGMVFDDGTVSRLADDRFLITTTTGGAATVLDWLDEYLQTEWPDLKVYCTSVTEQWSTVAVAGPKSRAVIEQLSPDFDLAPGTFPFMTFRDGTLAGIPARVSRISFSGELCYEVSVAWTRGAALWTALMDAGASFGVAAYGTEAMHVLRAEKGFIVVGHETDGTVTPQDLGLQWLVSKTKTDFIGKRSFARSDTKRADRKQLVGLLTDDPSVVLPEGAQLVEDPRAPLPVKMVGHVTSSYHSAVLGRSIALALVEAGRAREGHQLHAPLETRTHAARIVAPVFYDPDGTRRDG